MRFLYQLDLTMPGIWPLEPNRQRDPRNFQVLRLIKALWTACQLQRFVQTHSAELRGQFRQLQGSAKTLFQLAWIRRLPISFQGSALFSVTLDQLLRSFYFENARSWIS